ncbi:hypothetical protein SAMN04488581_3095 [Mycolicibacterium neoaurum]|jgi:hypothetical protein|uniref:Uncharacterized protein n=1 Tax=Mycolicibacterium neoaurum TaxID=1795 RepID=A0AAV2WJN1_MYCNE|nr:hypothetical protein BN1047_02245 [Mycolicibacterium neoaurum]SDD94385.1 hypothetical protein SAMN04488581_3095 [Mycolicibacterium neoaurum]
MLRSPGRAVYSRPRDFCYAGQFGHPPAGTAATVPLVWP